MCGALPLPTRWLGFLRVFYLIGVVGVLGCTDPLRVDTRSTGGVNGAGGAMATGGVTSSGGTSVSNCPTGVDTQSDNNNCGACGTICSASSPSTAQCTASRCLITLAYSPQGSSDIAVRGTSVFWTAYGTESKSYNDGLVMKVPVGGGAPSVLASGQPSPVGIAADDTSVYWTNAAAWRVDGTVMKVPVDGGTPAVLASGQPGPSGIAVDNTSVYWTNYFGFMNNSINDGSVMKVPLGGGIPTTLASGGQPNSVAVVREYRAIIWTKEASLPGRRVAVFAKGLEEARKRLEEEYGEGTVFDLHNEDDANRPR